MFPADNESSFLQIQQRLTNTIPRPVLPRVFPSFPNNQNEQ